MSERAVSDTAAQFMAVVALAEAEGLLRVEGEAEDDDPLTATTVYRMNDWSKALMESWGMKGEADTPEEREQIATAFLLMYSRKVGLPLVPDVVFHEAIDLGTLRIAAERDG